MLKRQRISNYIRIKVCVCLVFDYIGKKNSYRRGGDDVWVKVCIGHNLWCMEFDKKNIQQVDSYSINDNSQNNRE